MLSLLELKNTIINTKKGYSITPTVNSLKDLKALLNNMYTARTASGVYCSGHSGTSYEGKISLKEMNGALNNLKTCSCNSRAVNSTTCDCNARTSCSCNGRTSGCNCNNYSSGCSSVCTCNSRTDPGCDCQNRTGAPLCDQYYDTDVCSCESRNGCLTYFAANCSCRSRTAVNICTCYGRVATGGVWGSTPASGCTSQTASSDCISYVGALCPSRTTCTCNTVNEFS